MPAGAVPPSEPCWTLGEPAFDARLPGGRLAESLLELKPAAHGDWPAALAFAICLAARRQLSATALPPRPILWCATSAFIAEHGRPYGQGLAALGLSPSALIVAEPRREADLLWALEEGLRSRALSLAIGLVRAVELTPSRRLSLAAVASATPVLLLSEPQSPPAASAALRLRLGRAPGAPHPFDPRAPGSPRFSVSLERCREAPEAAGNLAADLEWCHVSYRFRLASGLADRSPASAVAGARSRL